MVNLIAARDNNGDCWIWVHEIYGLIKHLNICFKNKYGGGMKNGYEQREKRESSFCGADKDPSEVLKAANLHSRFFVSFTKIHQIYGASFALP